MSRFLDRLMARSFGVTETIRPQVPSLFEPLRAKAPHMTTGFGAEESLTASDASIAAQDTKTVGPHEQELEVVQSEHAVPPARHRRAVSALQPSTPEKQADYGVKGFSAPPPAEVRERLSSAWPPQPTAKNIPPVSSLPLLGSSPPSLHPEVERATVTKVATREEATGTSAVAVARVSAFGDGREPGPNLVEPDQALPLALPPTGRKTYPPQALVAQTPALPETGSYGEQTQRGLRFDHRKSQDHRHSAEPEPTIQVTIGRIEVRAEPSASPNVRKRLGPKPLSLEEYLRRRADRGR
jgi:hypothetical protein